MQLTPRTVKNRQVDAWYQFPNGGITFKYGERVFGGPRGLYHTPQFEPLNPETRVHDLHDAVEVFGSWVLSVHTGSGQYERT